uniref:Uncharacterized protein n=1 Tax=Anguilla anguilla TaxID=7936 RepID=A0A0E9QGB3_ANGAN
MHCHDPALMSQGNNSSVFRKGCFYKLSLLCVFGEVQSWKWLSALSGFQLSVNSNSFLVGNQIIIQLTSASGA